MKKQLRNSDELRTALLDCIKEVRTGKIETKEAQAIANLGARVIAIERLELDKTKFDMLTKRNSETK